MRHFFTEKHRLPIAWFAMRLNYSRSVATTSIVGHVLGLGDRHVSNILIDNNSGEVVHIDLGIAFDQVSLSCPVDKNRPIPNWSSVGETTSSTGTRTFPLNGRYGRRLWFERHRGCVPTVF
jgi:ataxia telangiectasia mutated family protein